MPFPFPTKSSLRHAWLVALSLLPQYGHAASDYVEGEVLVKYKAASGAAVRRQSRDRHGMAMTRDFPMLKGHAGGDIEQLRGNGKTTPEMLAELRADPAVEWAEPNYLRKLFAAPAPSDPGFPVQWGLRNTGQTVYGVAGAAGIDIRYLQALRMAKPSQPEVVVAVLDTGIDQTHLDLVPKLWTNPGEVPWDGIDNDGNGFVDDVHGYNFYNGNGNPADVYPASSHGTHVSGIIGAVTDNGAGVAGTCGSSRVMALRVAYYDSSAATELIDTGSEIAAFNYLVTMKNRGVNIVAANASFGGGSYSAAELAAIQAVGNAGIVVCAAAGNENSDNTAVPTYPANYRLPNMIVVAASGSNGSLASFSNYGTKVDLSAPGKNIYSTVTNWSTNTTYASTLSAGTTSYSAEAMECSGTTLGLGGALVPCGLGLAASDFPAAVNGNIALIGRGSATFASKVRLAMAAGAKGAVIYNNTTGLINGTLASSDAWIPVVSISQADGAALVAAPPSSAALSTLPTSQAYAYAYESGTSMATPYVSGAVAFAAANFPAESAAQRVARVVNGTYYVGALAGKVITSGMLDLTGILDPAHNQIPDWWEIQYFGAPGNAAADPDGDGFTNLQEFLTGTVPTDASSHLRISQSGLVANVSASDFRLTFPTALDVTYRVETSDNLVTWQALGTDFIGTGTAAMATDSAATSQYARRFYRVRIVSP